MSAPVTLLLVIGLSGGEVRSGQLSATLSAQLDEARVHVQVRRSDGVADLERALESASGLGPVAVVTNPRPGQLRIRVALRPGQWVSRTFTFEPQDPLAERNRTVALAIAAMVPEWRLPRPRPEPDRPPEPTQLAPLAEVESAPRVDAGASASRPELGSGQTVSRGGAQTLGASTAGIADAGSTFTAAPVVEPTSAVDAGSPALAAEASPAGTVVDAGPASLAADVSRSPPRTDGLGLELAVIGGTWPLAAGAQLGADYRSGRLGAGLLVRGQRASVDSAEATLWRVGVLALGRAQLPLGGDRLSGALLVSVGPGWVDAQRHEQNLSHWQLEGGLEAELAVRLGGTGWVFLRAGLAWAAGATPILVNDREIALVPAVSALGALGFRLGP